MSEFSNIKLNFFLLIKITKRTKKNKYIIVLQKQSLNS